MILFSWKEIEKVKRNVIMFLNKFELLFKQSFCDTCCTYIKPSGCSNENDHAYDVSEAESRHVNHVVEAEAHHETESGNCLLYTSRCV